MFEIEGKSPFHTYKLCLDYDLDYFQGSVISHVIEYKKTRQLSYIRKAIDVCNYCNTESRIDIDKMKPVIKAEELKDGKSIMRLLNDNLDVYLAQAVYHVLCNNYDLCKQFLMVLFNAVNDRRNENPYTYINGKYIKNEYGYGLVATITPVFEFTRHIGYKIHVGREEGLPRTTNSSIMEDGYYAPRLVESLVDAKNYASDIIQVEMDFVNGREDGIIRCLGSEFGFTDCVKCEYRKFGDHAVVRRWSESKPGLMSVNSMRWNADEEKYVICSGIDEYNYEYLDEYFERWYDDIYDLRLIELRKKYSGIPLDKNGEPIFDHPL